jgi:hypothetical protein
MTAAKSVLLKSSTSRRAVSLIGRLGYGARGAIYALVGISAVRATVDPGHPPGGFGEALKQLPDERLSALVLVLIAAGLACFAIWLVVAAVYRRDHPGREHWPLVAGMLGDAVVYLAFMTGVVGMIFGAWPDGGDHALQSWVGWLFSNALGRVFVGVTGAVVAGCGAGLIGWGAFGNIGGPLELSPAEMRMLRPIGRYGTCGRGVAIALVGFYLLISALHGNPREAHELGGMLKELRELPYGIVYTAAFAFAFIGSSLSDFAAAAFRRFDPLDPSALLHGKSKRARRSTRRASARAR